MHKDRGEVDRDVFDVGNWDAVVLEHIYMTSHQPGWNAAERLRRRRVLRRLLRRPAARIASRRLRRKRLLGQLDRVTVGDGFAALHGARSGELRRTLSQVPALRSTNGNSAPRAQRWSARAVPHGYAARSRLRPV